MDLKKLTKKQMLILLLCGALLMIIAIPAEKKDENTNQTGISAENDSTAYIQYLEQELEQMLSQMEGAGEVSCMLTLSESAEQIIEKDMEVSDDRVTESDSQGGTRTTSQSARTEMTVYDEENEGSPYVTKEISPKVEGVLVIAEGGDNAVVVQNITEAVQALFGIESHKIRIVKKGVNLK